MEALTQALSSRLDFIFFFYGLSFTAMGLILLSQPKDGSSFILADSLWLLGGFGIVHGANEFLDMWTLIKHPESAVFELIKLAVLLLSYLFLFEFGRRAMRALWREKKLEERLPFLLGNFALPAIAALVFLLAALHSSPLTTAPLLARLLVGFPGAILTAWVFLGYSKARETTLTRLGARNYFRLTAFAFLAYGILSGLVTQKADFFPSNVLNSEVFLTATGIPVQLFRALCAILACWGTMGGMRIFREGALQAAQQELLDIIEFFPDATFVIDKEKKVIAWNRAIENMTGVRKKDMLGKGDFAYAVPFLGKAAPMLIDLIGVPAPEAERPYDYVQKRPDGIMYAETFAPLLYGGIGAHVWVTTSPLLDKEGNVYGAIESVRDVTDHKLAKEALQQSEAQYRAIIETANTGFLITSADGEVLDANQEYVRLTGRRRLSDIRGRSVLEWAAAHEKNRVHNAMMECLRTGHIRNFETAYSDRQGKAVPIEISATSIKMGGTERVLALCRDITDRKLAENLLKESEDKFRTLTEKSMIGVYLIQDGAFRHVNPMMAKIFGYAPGELIGVKGPKDLVCPEDWPAVDESLRQRMAGKAHSINYSFRGVRKDGEMIYVEVFGSGIDYLGKPAVLGTLLDITDRKRAQRALKDAEERGRLILNSAGDGIIGVDVGGRVLFANDAAQAMLGWNFEELKGRELHPLIHHTRPDGSLYPVEDCPMHVAFTRNISGRVEDELLWRKNGSSFFVSYSAQPIIKAGATEGAVITFRDMTPMKQAQNALRESEERYRTLVSNAQVGIVVHRGGRIKFANKKMAELLRAEDPRSLSGRDLDDLRPGRILTAEEHHSPVPRLASQPATEEKFMSLDGFVLDVETRSVPINYEGETCTMSICMDITARKQAELESQAAHQQLMETNLKLEKRVEERTEQLVELNKELEAFSYSAAHDLKAPLRRIHTFTELLEQDAGASLGTTPQKHLFTIRKAAAQMNSLVDGLLTLSTTGKKPLDITGIRLSVLLEEAMTEVKAENAGRWIEWEVDRLPEVNCDRAMLKQVFINLLSNAAKYTRGRSPARIEVTYKVVGDCHVFGVKDNGVGFSMDYADRLFGVFQRLHRAEEFEGSGIGLSTVKRIITRHGGRVWAESEPDKGAAFYFSLPAHPRAECRD